MRFLCITQILNIVNNKITSSNLITIFSEVNDPRRDVLKLHKLNDTLFISVLVVICSADDTWKKLKSLPFQKKNS